MNHLHYYYPAVQDDGSSLDPRKSESGCRGLFGKSAGTDIPYKDQKDIATQLVISVSLGLGAFVTFCILRTRWSSLYAARKRQRATASSLPDLPDTFFGWIPILYRISEKEVLTAAGLDAWVVGIHERFGR